jgi:hypothetical protein
MNFQDEIRHGLGNCGGEGAFVAMGIVTGPPRCQLGQGSGGQRLLVMEFPIATPSLAHTAKEPSSLSLPFVGSQRLLPDWVCRVPGSVCHSFSFSSTVLGVHNVALLSRLEDPPRSIAMSNFDGL